MRSKPASRVDIIAAAVTLLLLATLVFGQVSDPRELANRSTCAANLRGIMQSFVVYASDNDDVFPALPLPTSATTYDVTFKGLTASGTAEQARAAMNKDESLRSNPSIAFWILALDGDVAAKQFICKSDPTVAPSQVTNAKQEYYLNFPNANSFSYSTAYPWTEKNGKVAVSALWKNTVDASLPIVTDMAPYLGRTAEDIKHPGGLDVPATPEARAQTARLIADLASPDFATREAATKELAAKGPAAFPGLRDAAATSNDPELVARVMDSATSPTEKWVVTKANSSNHFFDGQNIAYADAHAEFLRNPAAGQSNESIWGTIKDPKGDSRQEIPIGAGTLPHALTGNPGDFDTVMVPARDARGNLK